MSKFFKDLKEGLEEAVEYQKGKKALRSKMITIKESGRLSKKRKAPR